MMKANKIKSESGTKTPKPFVSKLEEPAGELKGLSQTPSTKQHRTSPSLGWGALEKLCSFCEPAVVRTALEALESASAWDNLPCLPPLPQVWSSTHHQKFWRRLTLLLQHVNLFFPGTPVSSQVRVGSEALPVFCVCSQLAYLAHSPSEKGQTAPK